MNTVDRTFLDTEQYKKAELKTYSSITALHEATGIPKTLLLAAKKKNCTGFYANGTVNYKTAKDAIVKMLDALDEATKDDIAFWSKENKKKDVILKDLQIKKLESEMIEPSEVKALLVELATKQSVVIKRIFTELPPKCAGKSEVDIKIILDEAQKEIFGVLKDKSDTI
jgi:hypothetical protein